MTAQRPNRDAVSDRGGVGRRVTFEPGEERPQALESLVALSLRVYAQRSEAHLAHLRMHRGDHEVDLIVERRDGRCLGVEVKLSPVDKQY